jgi:tetratricopeptide (TPR) repeat protein
MHLTDGRMIGTFWLASAAALLSTAAASSSIAAPRDLQLAADDLAQIAVKLKNLTENSLKPGSIEGTRSFAQRMTDAEILFLLGDHGRASLVLFDLVTDRSHEQEPLYKKAIYYLGEAQYQIGNYLSAREQFEDLVRRRDGEHLRDTIRRLIQIADRLEHWEHIEDHVEVLRQSGPLPPDIAYIFAKSLLRQRRSVDARKVALEVPAEHRLSAKARYLAAVALVQAGHMEAARADFEKLLSLAGNYDDLALVHELAAMNRGRILLDEGQLAASVDAYQQVGRDSSLFDEALYEVAWNYVRAAGDASQEELRDAEYKKAQNTLEILLLSEQENTLAPEARLLLGNILMRLGRFDDASVAFGDVVKRYAPLRDELIESTSKVENSEQFFDEVVARTKTGGSLLPALAVRWASNADRLKKATNLVTELDQGEAWIRESQALIDKLLTVLNSERRAQFFPHLHDIQLRRLELQNSLASLTKRLVIVERAVLEDDLSDDQQRELARVLAERETLEPDFKKLPQSKAEYDSRITEIKDRLVELQKQAYQLRYPIRTMQGSLEAMQNWLAENAKALGAGDLQGFRERMELQRREVTELTRLQEELEADVVRDKGLLGETTAAEARDEETRTRYAATLDREREILRVAGVGADSDKRRDLDEIERLRLLIAGYHTELNAFAAELEGVLAAKAHEVKQRVLAEVKTLTDERTALEADRREARQVIGEVAASAIAEVRQKFEDIVLRADVGIVDVAWQLKEEQTRNISRGVNEQKRELQVLDSDFGDVLNND